MLLLLVNDCQWGCGDFMTQARLAIHQPLICTQTQPLAVSRDVSAGGGVRKFAVVGAEEVTHYLPL